MLQNPKIQEPNQTLNYAEPRETYKTLVSVSAGHSYNGCQAACGGGEAALGGAKKALAATQKSCVQQDSRRVGGIHIALYHLLQQTSWPQRVVPSSSLNLLSGVHYLKWCT